MTRPRSWLLVATAVTLGASGAVLAQRDFSKVEIKSEKLAEGIWMLTGAGGNIGVCAGADGVLLIDDQFAPLTDKIRAVVAKLSDKPIRFVFNTHWHGDHTGGNENLAGTGTLIVAHDNVRRRLSVGQLIGAAGSKVEPAPAAALPVITFTDSVTFHLNGDDLTAFHVPHAHTDGDAIVLFHKADVVHMGDCFFNGMYPRIDVASGGSVDGMIAAIERVLPVVGPQTRVIPGHGPLGDRAALVAFHDMLVGVRDKVRELARAGKSLQEVQAAKPSAAFDATWGKGFIQPDKFVESVYAGATAAAPAH